MGFSLADVLVLVSGAILPGPAVPSNTRISAWLKRTRGHVSRVNVARRPGGVLVAGCDYDPRKVRARVVFRPIRLVFLAKAVKA